MGLIILASRLFNKIFIFFIPNFFRAEKDLKDHTVILEDWSAFVQKLNEKNIIMSPFCGEISCEDKIKQDSARYLFLRFF